MRFWWVNQNQMFRQEIRSSYLWSPKVRSNGTRNPCSHDRGLIAFEFDDRLFPSAGR